MQINWFTLIAQIVNFVILVFLLKYLLYDRITKAMDERKESMETKLKEADEKKQTAENEVESYQQKKHELEKSREQVLLQAKKDADSERRKLMEDAREEVEQSKARWTAAIQLQKESFLSDIRERAGEQVYRIIRRAMKDIADNHLEREIINTFIRKVEEVMKGEDNAVTDLISGGKEEIEVRTSFEMDQKLRQKIISTIRKHGDERVRIKFYKSSKFMCGIELLTGGKKITWSLDEYIDGLEEKLSEELKRYDENK